ncbi:MAG TPA: prepilin-type N-terminal cleavage/methylation domain-containing protein [Candidatus Wallbacteria bacterium]|nr:prepilin-type N-terminal cleavage/methylation domain-containing protein [Candidatus Wallbacteria bacterium]
MSFYIRIKTLGFSLIEVLVAIVILILAVVPVIQMINTSTSGITRTSDQTQALYIGRYILERIIARSTGNFDAISSESEMPCTGPGAGYYMKSYMRTGNPVSEFNYPELYEQIKIFKSVIDVENIATPPDLKKVGIKIKWKYRGYEKSVSLSTYIYKRY